LRAVLLDESVPRQIAEPLRQAGYEVSTVEQAGLKGLKNGDLLRAAEGRFDVLLTADQSIHAQQNLRGQHITIAALPTNRRRAVLDRAADIVDTLQAVAPGQHVRIAGGGRRTVSGNDDPAGSSISLPPVKPFNFGGSGG
jgi:predicted nuclease of predicted toxin-antitoxin system